METDFAINLKLLLKKKNMSLSELSKITGISLNTLNKYRPGLDISPSFETVIKIAKALQTEPAYFSTGLTSDMALAMLSENESTKEEIVEEISVLLKNFSMHDLNSVFSIVKSISEKYE